MLKQSRHGNFVSFSTSISSFFSSKTRKRFLLSLTILAVCAVALLASVSSAADPSSGTITPASGPLSYSAGPFIVANESGQGGVLTPVCEPGTPLCDEYTLTVNAASVAATKKLLIQIAWPNSTADFDMYIFQGSTEVASSHATSDPETVFLNIPADGTVYTIRVIPTTPLGESITGTIALVDPPASTQTGSGLAPRYQNYAASEGLGDNAGEPSLGVDWNPNVASLKHDKVNTGGVSFFQSGPNTLRASFDDCSSPAKDQWDDVSTPFVQQAALSDPIGFVDRQTGRVFSLDLIGGQGNSLMAFSDDDGNSFTPGQGGGAPAGPDHETLGGGPYNPNATPAPPPHPLYPNAVYYASQNIVGDAEVSRSDNGGLTFGPSVLLFNPTQCTGGIHGHIKVAPDGTVYVPNSSCSTGGGTNGVAVSTDNGITWTAYTVPGSTGTFDPSVGVGLNDVGKPLGQTTNTIYMGWISGDNHPHVAVSRNRGQTWIRDFDIGAQVGVKSAVFPVVVAGDDNRAAFGFLGTTTPGDAQDDNNFRGVWHLYIATTYDAGASWITIDATPDDPVQVGSICLGGTACGALDPLNPSSRNLLDFNDFTVDSEGRALLGYADGCVAPACNSGTVAKTPPYFDSRASKAAIARQSGGRRLFAAFDPLEPAAPAAPRVNSVNRTGSGVVHLDWSEPDNGGSAITGYRIYRRTQDGTYGAALATVVDKTTYDDETATDAAATYFYKVTAVNLIGEGQSCSEHSAVPAPDPCEVPGVQVLSDPTGDGFGSGIPSAQPPYDIQSVSVAEPYSVGLDKLVFTIKVKDLSVVPGGSFWPLQFNAPNGTTYVVQMSTLTGGTPTDNDAIFEYGPDGGTLSPADPLSGFSADGTITIVVPRSGVGNAAVGQHLNSFLIRVTAVALTPDNCPDSLTPAGDYTIVGNASCQPNTAPIAVLSAVPTSGNSPLNVNFSGANSTDSDPGDTIASYSFDFGDGTAVVTQASATTMHTYQDPGTYPARLSVKDSRGKSSTNPEQVIITVTNPSPTPTPTPTPEPSGCNGTRIEDDDTHISYSNGWHSISNSGASSGHFRLNEGGNNNHNVALTFNTPAAQSGTITYLYATSPKGGSAEIFIDGVSKGTVNYNGASGSNRAPVFGSSRNLTYGAAPGGNHTLEIRPVKNAVYIDGFCLGSAAATGAPSTGPGTTSESSGTQAAGQSQSRSLSLPAGTRAISVAVESSINVPVQLVLLDPSGRVVQIVNSSSGVAILEAPITQGGVYIIKTVNLSLGPIQLWSVATPWVAR
ncbi:MAG TPA: PKD domain-containing protein [Pyrinomonadaceae bacterium]|nr:PKD domain-containing protein [Pyrinomonadaceae bacterium]